METIRTPDERFVDLPDFPFEPHYVEIDDLDGGTLRVHHLDEGPVDGPVIVLAHGEPSWCYLYRHMIPLLVEAGFRCIAPDLVGFGRSDKPLSTSDYTYERHVAWFRSHILDALDLTDITLVCQDWGGLISLRLVAEHPERFARVVAANTLLGDGTTTIGQAFFNWRQFALEVEELPVGAIVNMGSMTELSAEVIAAYDAPFPTEEFKAGARIFPQLVPTEFDSPSAAQNRDAWASLATFTKPFLTAFSDSDPVTKGDDRRFVAEVPGAVGQPHTTIEGGGHFLQEDCGPALAKVVISFIKGS
ncbi:MAG: haloalkane dehalogenase [Actinomycetes bacterium]